MGHTNRALAALAALSVLAAAVVGGCGGATAAQPASPSPSAPPPSGPPSAPGDIAGVVRDVRLSAGDAALPVLLVVADAATSGQIDRAAVSVTPGTVVWTATGERGRPADLKEGDSVAVWFSGPVAESYPVQAKAGVIQILQPE